MNDDNLDYDEWVNELYHRGVEDPSYLHGLLCASVIAENDEAARQRYAEWFAEMMKEEDDLSVYTENIIDRGRSVMRAQLYSSDFGVELMVPDDDAAMIDRLTAIGAWCRGFLKGLSVFDHPKFRSHDDIAEALDDFAEIAEVDEEEADDDEVDEARYYQLHEYVRVAVMLIFTECVLDENDDSDAGGDGPGYSIH